MDELARAAARRSARRRARVPARGAVPRRVVEPLEARRRRARARPRSSACTARSRRGSCRASRKKAKVKVAGSARPGTQELREMWQAIGACERLDARLKAELGDVVVADVERGKAAPQQLWALARLGAREPLYGPLNCVVAGRRRSPAGSSALLALAAVAAPRALAFALVQIARVVGDRERDLDEALRERLAARLARRSPVAAAAGAAARGGPARSRRDRAACSTSRCRRGCASATRPPEASRSLVSDARVWRPPAQPRRGFMRQRAAPASRRRSAISASVGTATSARPAPRSMMRRQRDLVPAQRQQAADLRGRRPA